MIAILGSETLRGITSCVQVQAVINSIKLLVFLKKILQRTIKRNFPRAFGEKKKKLLYLLEQTKNRPPTGTRYVGVNATATTSKSEENRLDRYIDVIKPSSWRSTAVFVLHVMWANP